MQSVALGSVLDDIIGVRMAPDDMSTDDGSSCASDSSDSSSGADAPDDDASDSSSTDGSLAESDTSDPSDASSDTSDDDAACLGCRFQHPSQRHHTCLLQESTDDESLSPPTPVAGPPTTADAAAVGGEPATRRNPPRAARGVPPADTYLSHPSAARSATRVVLAADAKTSLAAYEQLYDECVAAPGMTVDAVRARWPVSVGLRARLLVAKRGVWRMQSRMDVDELDRLCKAMGVFLGYDDSDATMSTGDDDSDSGDEDANASDSTAPPGAAAT